MTHVWNKITVLYLTVCGFWLLSSVFWCSAVLKQLGGNKWTDPGWRSCTRFQNNERKPVKGLIEGASQQIIIIQLCPFCFLPAHQGKKHDSKLSLKLAAQQHFGCNRLQQALRCSQLVFSAFLAGGGSAETALDLPPLVTVH